MNPKKYIVVLNSTDGYFASLVTHCDNREVYEPTERSAHNHTYRESAEYEARQLALELNIPFIQGVAS